MRERPHLLEHTSHTVSGQHGVDQAAGASRMALVVYLLTVFAGGSQHLFIRTRSGRQLRYRCLTVQGTVPGSTTASLSFQSVPLRSMAQQFSGQCNGRLLPVCLLSTAELSRIALGDLTIFGIIGKRIRFWSAARHLKAH